ncbi:hypothetical protein EPK99_08995 [Neorhizobium lilium]|uniref:DUF1127 domain-containing protein n=1 Tax=Neorhizobium lilium TaxID=2503024 RepID=A0A3S3RI94_9HYPH|nr:hypothetical protein [Neorhizobium lilium]RWX78719.1 hypothetical protein EPK99_08995 [Neorhizobium lilium]
MEKLSSSVPHVFRLDCAALSEHTTSRKTKEKSIMFWRNKMFASIHQPYGTALPKLRIFGWLGRKAATHQNRLYPDEMPDSLKRDLGLMDGRMRRGRPSEDGSRAVMRLFRVERGL